MQRPSWAPPEVDIDRPASSRIYDYMLGGSHNFAVDREIAQRAIAAMPQLPAVLAANRSFLRRAVRYLAAEGSIDQFLDLGSGIPTVGNVHEITGQINESARVVYVDIDPIAVLHAQAILTDYPNATSLQADLRHPLEILSDPTVTEMLDFTRPVAVLLVATLHFLPEQQPAAIVSQLRAALPSGSYITISHASDDGQPPAGQRDALDVYARADNEVIMRTGSEVSALADGWALVEPGVVRLPLWHPDPDEAISPDDANFPGYGMVARRP